MKQKRTTVTSVLFILATTLLLGACAKEQSASTLEGNAPQVTEVVATQPLGVAVNPGSATVSNQKNSEQALEEGEFEQLAAASEKYGRFQIYKNSLEKEYLLRGHTIAQGIAPMGSSLQSMVVAFRKYGNYLYMLRANQGHLVTKGLPNDMVLAAFTIQDESESSYEVDWNEGMRNAFFSSDWWASDFAGVMTNLSLLELEGRISLIKEITQEDLAIGIKQVIRTTPGPSKEPIVMEFRYYLEPYKPDASFAPFKQADTDRFRYFGYFESHPKLEAVTGNPILFASKFNEKKPIVFHISANTPKELQGTVRDAILYWNRAFGSDVVQVKIAPEGITAPARGYNMVQWVPFDNAGFAYADANMDPRTGQILQANVYLTSAFTADLDVLLGRIVRNLRDEQTKQLPSLGHRLCEYEAKQKFSAQIAKKFSSGEVSKEQVDKARKDYLYEVVAHEIGHTLGLRHNFAGNLGANITYQDRITFFNRYIDSLGRSYDTDMRTTSSMMEYNPFIDGVLMANLAQQKQDMILEYDALAIQNLYLSKVDTEKTKTPAFCTDTSVGKYLDCMRFDSGNDIIAEKKDALQKAIGSDLVSGLVNRIYIATKKPLSEFYQKEVHQYELDSKTMVKNYTDRLAGLLEVWQEKARLLKLEKTLYASKVVTDTKRKEMHRNFVELGFDARSDFKSILTLLEVPFTEDKEMVSVWTKQLEKVLAKEPYRSAFSAVEQDILKARLTDLYVETAKNIDSAALSALAKALAGTKKAPHRLIEGNWLFQLETALQTLAAKIVTQDSEQAIVGATYDGKAIVLPLYSYTAAERSSALDLLDKNPSPSTINDWQFAGKLAIKAELTKVRDKLIAIDKEIFKPENLEKVKPREARQWFLTEAALFKKL